MVNRDTTVEEHPASEELTESGSRRTVGAESLTTASPRTKDDEKKKNEEALLRATQEKQDSKKEFTENTTDYDYDGELRAELIDDMDAHHERIMKEAKADIISKAVLAEVHVDEGDSKNSSKGRFLCILLGIGMLLGAAIVGGVCGTGNCSGGGRVLSTREIVDTIQSASSNPDLQYLGDTNNDTNENTNAIAATPQEEALRYVVENVPADLSSGEDDAWRFVQRYALCVFLYTNARMDSESNEKEQDWFAENSHDECFWEGISCNNNGRVTEISMRESALLGSLPHDLGLLTDVQILDLAGNDLEGSLPTALQGLVHLEVLDIEDNKFTGSLFPPFLETSLVQLKQYNVARNAFTGTIPTGLASQTLLSALHTAYNRNLVGSVPSSLGALTALTSLTLGRGVFTGTLPTFLQTMTNLEHLAIEKSAFVEGTNEDLSLYSQLTQLTHLRMASMLKQPQTIPSILGDAWPLMENFEILRNQITGTLPASLAQWTSLKVFSVLYNDINGTIPQEYFESWTDLDALRVNGNSITGTLPTSVGLLSNLESFDISDNKITGTLPTEVGVMTGLEHFFVNDNQFTGTIPVQVLEFPAALLWFENNNFTGAAPFCPNGQPTPRNAAEVDCDEVFCPCCILCSDEAL